MRPSAGQVGRPGTGARRPLGASLASGHPGLRRRPSPPVPGPQHQPRGPLSPGSGRTQRGGTASVRGAGACPPTPSKPQALRGPRGPLPPRHPAASRLPLQGQGPDLHGVRVPTAWESRTGSTPGEPPNPRWLPAAPQHGQLPPAVSTRPSHQQTVSRGWRGAHHPRPRTAGRRGSSRAFISRRHGGYRRSPVSCAASSVPAEPGTELPCSLPGRSGREVWGLRELSRSHGSASGNSGCKLGSQDRGTPGPERSGDLPGTRLTWWKVVLT